MNFPHNIPVTPNRFGEIKLYFDVTAYSFEDDKKEKYHELFHKKAQIKFSSWSDRLIISFGGPCKYYAEDLIKHKDSDSVDFCIDACGRNHSGDGRAVYVSKMVAVN